LEVLDEGGLARSTLGLIGIRIGAWDPCNQAPVPVTSRISQSA